MILDESLLGISTEQLIESPTQCPCLRQDSAADFDATQQNHLVKGSRWRALPDEYAPIEETPYSSFSANSRANNSDAESRTTLGQCCSSAQANVRRPDAALSKPFSDGELLSYVGSLATDSPRHDHSWQSHVGHHESQGLLRIHSQRNHCPVWNTVCLKRWSRLMASSSTPASWSNLSAAHSFEQQGLLKNALYTLDKKPHPRRPHHDPTRLQLPHSIAGLNQYSRMPWGTGGEAGLVEDAGEGVTGVEGSPLMSLNVTEPVPLRLRA